MSKTPNERFFVRIDKTAFIPSVPHWQYKLASAPNWRFYWNMSPGAWVTSGNADIELTPDTAILIPPQTPFSTKAVKKFSHFFIHFSLSGNIAAKREIIKIDIKSIIPDAIAAKLPFYSEKQLSFAASAVVNMSLLMLPPEILISPERNLDELIFDKAMRIIEQSPEKFHNCVELAKLCGTSINTLQRQFRKATGLPVKKWLMHKKMEYAAQLLTHSGATIKETADRLGFADRYHFSKTFKQYFGIGPAGFIRSGGTPLP